MAIHYEYHVKSTCTHICMFASFLSVQEEPNIFRHNHTYVVLVHCNKTVLSLHVHTKYYTPGFLPSSAAASIMKPPYAIGSVPSLSGHAFAYRWRSLPRVRRHRASKPQGSSERVLPWQITVDQLIFASLSHTHYWYEVGMLKVPASKHGVHNTSYVRTRTCQVYALAGVFFCTFLCNFVAVTRALPRPKRYILHYYVSDSQQYSYDDPFHFRELHAFHAKHAYFIVILQTTPYNSSISSTDYSSSITQYWCLPSVSRLYRQYFA